MSSDKHAQTALDWSAYEHTDSFGGFGDFDSAEPADAATGYAKAAATCMGKRECLRNDAGVMCPSFRVTGDPTHSPLHRAEILKAALAGELGAQPFSKAALTDALALCVACKGCKSECPHGVDIALMRAEALAQKWRELGQVPLRTQLFAHLPRIIMHLKYFNWISAVRKHLPQLSRTMASWTGIAAQRSLPRMAARSFLSSVARRPTQIMNAREVVLLVDTFSNHLDPEIASAALEVLQAAGYTVHIAQPPENQRPLCCGRTYLSQGLIAEARNEAMRLLDALTPFAGRGLPVIGLEPSCLLMLRDEYHALGLGERVATLARSALLLEEFLAREHAAGRLILPLKALAKKVLVHGHCHQKAFGAMNAMSHVLALIPQLQIELIESSCCGMAGSFGMEAEHYEISMQMGERALLPRIRAASTETLLVANGTSCRHQITDGTARPTLHLAQLLSLALHTAD